MLFRNLRIRPFADQPRAPILNPREKCHRRYVNGGARSRSIDRAEASHRNVVEQMRQIKLQVEEDIDRALSVIREARARLESLVIAVARAEEVARIEQLLLETGSGTQTDFLTP